jgi:fluoride exporter
MTPTAGTFSVWCSVTPESSKSVDPSPPAAIAPARSPGGLARYGAVTLGGIVGALLRYGQGALFAAVLPGAFPWGTFSINIAGSVALCAFLAALAETAGAHPLWRPFFAVGFCGAYTTFSSFENESLALVTKGHADVAIAYVVASVLVGLVTGFLGAGAVRGARRLRVRLASVPPLILAPVITFIVAGVVVSLLGRVEALSLPTLVEGCLGVAIGGLLGAVARYAVAAYAADWFGSFFPWGTFIINITGSLLIGLFEGVAGRPGGLPPIARLFLVTGFLGGYTTFSTFMYETLALAREGGRRRAGANVAGSVIGGFVAVAAGRLLGQMLVEKSS